MPENTANFLVLHAARLDVLDRGKLHKGCGFGCESMGGWAIVNNMQPKLPWERQYK